jgi:hypothetical protein
MAGLNLVQQGQQNRAEAKQAKSNARAIKKANTENTVRTGYQIGLLNVQRGQNRQRRQQQLADLGIKRSVQIGTATANQAASETVGSSADAVLQDIRMQLDRERASVENDLMTDEFNYNIQLADTVQAGMDALQEPEKYRKKSLGSMLLNAGMSVGSMYAGDLMSLGLGTPGSTGGSGKTRKY